MYTARISDQKRFNYPVAGQKVTALVTGNVLDSISLSKWQLALKTIGLAKIHQSLHILLGWSENS
jgi:hypothetical protein